MSNLLNWLKLDFKFVKNPIELLLFRWDLKMKYYLNLKN